MKRPEGFCHICGDFGPLSFEHVPPRAAFNDRRVVEVKFKQALHLGPDEIAKGTIRQRGMGGYTLCEVCNTKTGHWYGRRFVDWCYQGMDILIRSEGQPTLFYLNYLFPLSILKEIITMFFSVNSHDFREAHWDLERFILNKEARYLPQKYRFFVYYNIEGRFRMAGITAQANINKHKIVLMSEITYPPFGYVMTLNSAPPDDRLIEITHFAGYAYNQLAVGEMKLPVLPTHLVYPGDYRTKEEIFRQTRENKAAAQKLKAGK